MIHQQRAKTGGHLEKTANCVRDERVGAERGGFDGKCIVDAAEHKPLKINMLTQLAVDIGTTNVKFILYQNGQPIHHIRWAFNFKTI